VTSTRPRRALAPRHVFLGRLYRSFAWSALTIAVSLAIGMAGYHWLAGFGWIDAFLNAAMILGGMGPVGELTTAPAKLFAGIYALFAGLVLVGATGLILAPVLHRMMHRFHLDDTDGAD
jgi:hypothetical protein